MLYILLGKDDFSLKESLKEIKKGIGAAELLEANTSELEGSELTSEQLKMLCATVPFLAEKRLIIVRGLLEHFQQKERGTQQKRPSSAQNKKDEYRPFADVIKDTPQSTILVLVDSEVKSDNPLLLVLKTNARMVSFPLKRGKELTQWIQKQVQTAGGSISAQAANLLARLVGSNLWIMSNEVNKLILFASGRRIEEEDVNSLVTSAREVSVFNLVDAILEGKCDMAEGLLQRLLMTGEAPPPYLLFMLARQLQLTVRMKDMREGGRPKAEIQSRLGLTAEFAWQKTLEQSGRYGFPRLKEIYQKLLETDLAIKTGKYDGEMALSILVAELCQKEKAA